MKKKRRVKIKREITKFSKHFRNSLLKLLPSFERFQPNIRNAMPSIFNSKNIIINTYFSGNRNHVMILFEKFENNDFTFTITKNNIFDALDQTGTWKKSRQCAFNLNNISGFLESCKINGVKPFEIIGENNNITISNFKFTLPNGENKTIPFGYIFSYSVFKEILANIDNYIENVLYSFWDYYRKNNEEKLNSFEKEKKYKKYIEDLLKKMNRFFNEQVEERKIDEFITKNPIILERCLDINPGSLLPQANLKNWIQENFKQDMKPDLICQNIYDDWTIIDYKRAKRIIKKNKTARADITADVHGLKTQIKTYREYFDEEKHRKSFFQKTGYKIPSKPQGIGIIGNVLVKERKTFRDSIGDFPGCIRIIPYNDLYTKFEKYYNDLR